MDNQALPPSNNLNLNFRKIAVEQSEAEKKLYEDDNLWASFGDSPAYRLVKKYILKLIENLDNMEGQAFENGASLEEIGLRRAVNRLTRANLMSIINKVENTSRAVDERKKRSQTG